MYSAVRAIPGIRSHSPTHHLFEERGKEPGAEAGVESLWRRRTEGVLLYFSLLSSAPGKECGLPSNPSHKITRT